MTLASRHSFVGNAKVGWKIALCERCLAIFTGLLAFGATYGAAKRRLRPAGVVHFSVLIAPLAVDGLTQLAGLRDNRWDLRVCTGLLFGAAAGWSPRHSQDGRGRRLLRRHPQAVLRGRACRQGIRKRTPGGPPGFVCADRLQRRTRRRDDP